MEPYIGELYDFPGYPHPPKRRSTLKPYYRPTEYSEKHGVEPCSKNFTCDDYHACDIDTNICLSRDILPSEYVIRWKDRYLTGANGKRLVDYLLANGASLEDMLEGNIWTSTHMREYLETLSAFARAPAMPPAEVLR